MTSTASNARPAVPDRTLAKRGRPQAPTAWEWLSGWASSQGIDLKLMQPMEATQHLLATLDDCRRHGHPLPPATVGLASLLVRIQVHLAIQGDDLTWQAAQPLIEQAYARHRARGLSFLLENWQPPRPRPVILEPEPADEPVTLFDLVRTFHQVLQQIRSSRPAAPPSRNNSGSVA